MDIISVIGAIAGIIAGGAGVAMQARDLAGEIKDSKHKDEAEKK